MTNSKNHLFLYSLTTLGRNRLICKRFLAIVVVWMVGLFGVIGFENLAVAQEAGIFARCSEGEATRICGYDSDKPGPPVSIYPIRSNSTTRASINGGRLALAVNVVQENMIVATDVFLSDVDGGNASLFVRIPLNNFLPRDIALSPDLQRLAYIEGDKIKVYDQRSGITTEVVSEDVTFNGSWGMKWSPDGRKIAFTKNVTPPNIAPRTAIATVLADGSESSTNITNAASISGTYTSVFDEFPDWSPDGLQISFVRTISTSNPRTRTTFIHIISEDGGEPITVYSTSEDFFGISGLEWSVDGAKLAFLDPRRFGGDAGIFTIPASGGTPTRFSTEVVGQGQTWANELIEWQGLSKELIVNDTRDREDADLSDDVCDADTNITGRQCTLRAAIQTAQSVAGPDSISFNIEGDGIHTITLTRALPAITEELIIDATTEEDYDGSPLIQLRGSSSVGLNIQAENSIVRGLSIGGFSSAGVQITGDGGVKIEKNYIGVSANGVTSVPNGAGIQISGSPNNKIGGSKPELRNVLSGNSGPGIIISGDEATGNEIAGNRIGTSAAGTSALPNGGDGVRIINSPGNTVGGDDNASGNVISGNEGNGIFIEGSSSDGTIVEGNYIGTDASGMSAIPNEAGGVRINGAPNSSIGTETLGNVIAGNGGIGVLVNGHLTEGHSDGTLILNNIVGLDASGELPLINVGESVIRLDGASRQSKVGQPGAGNVIAGNADMIGVDLVDLGEVIGAPDGTQVAANHIGITKSGSPLNEYLLYGVVLSVEAEDGGGTVGVIGGEDGSYGNRIQGPVVSILVEGERSSGSMVAYNVIGNQDEALPADDRDPVGVWINGANQVQVIANTIGGQSSGIVLGSNESTLTLNRIGTNQEGSAARSNSIGLWIPGEVGQRNFSTGDGNIIGNDTGSNLISGNSIAVLVGGSFNPFSAEKRITGTWSDIPNFREKVIASLPAFRSLSQLLKDIPDSLNLRLSSNKTAVFKTEENGVPDNNTFRLNRIGTNLVGDREIGNGRSSSEDDASVAVRIESGTNNRLIGNLISGNGGGVYVGPDSDFETTPENTVLAGNIIGGSLASETASIPNQYGGVIIIGTTGTRLQALPIADGGDAVGNSIRGNGNAGVQIGIVENDNIGNQIRQSSFFDNKGPAIMILDSNQEYPSIAPSPPVILAASALPGNASLAFFSHTSGVVDGFISEKCEDGRAQGEYSFSLNVEPGTSLVELPYSQLKSNSEDATSLYMALTVTSAEGAGMTSEFSDCYRIARESDIDSTSFSINDKGELINGAGIKVEINSDDANKMSVHEGQESDSSENTEGVLYAARYRVDPVDGPIDGTAMSSDGSMITPDMVSEDRYWSLQSTGIESIDYSVCLDIDMLPGADVPEQLVVMYRPSATQPWAPYNTILEDGQLCATGFSRFGQFGIGGSGDVNYLPVEPDVVNLPTEFLLGSNYPNPFNPTTIIPFSLPEAVHVRIGVYDMTGRKTATLVNRPMPAGKHEIRFDAGNLASGLYFIRIEAGRFRAAQKMMLIK